VDYIGLYHRHYYFVAEFRVRVYPPSSSPYAIIVAELCPCTRVCRLLRFAIISDRYSRVIAILTSISLFSISRNASRVGKSAIYILN